MVITCGLGRTSVDSPVYWDPTYITRQKSTLTFYCNLFIFKLSWYSIRPHCYWSHNDRPKTLKGLCHRVLAPFPTAKIYICVMGNKNDTQFSLAIAILVGKKILSSVFGCRWLGCKWITTWKTLAKISSCFHESPKKKKDVNGRGLFSL